MSRYTPRFDVILDQVQQAEATYEETLAAAIMYAGETIANAIDHLAIGADDGPGAVEAIAMSLGGNGLKGSVAESLSEVAAALNGLDDGHLRVALIGIADSVSSSK